MVRTYCPALSAFWRFYSMVINFQLGKENEERIKIK
jgi:hypothetical protein